MIKLCCHVTDRGVINLCFHVTDPFEYVCFLTKSCYVKRSDVTAQFGHVTGYGVIKMVKIKNKVKKRLSLK